MEFDRDIALAGDRVGGLALDAESAQNIPFVGFDDDDAGGSGDIPFVGFAEDTTASQADAVANHPARQGLGQAARQAVLAVWSAARALVEELHRRLTRTHLHVRRLRAAVVPAIAILAAIGAGLALRSWLPARQPEKVVMPPPPPRPPLPSVLVATRPIDRGGILRPTDMQWQPWPPADIKQSYFRQGTRHYDLDGYVARTPIAMGQPLSTGDIVAPAGHGFMAAMLRPGMRAISIAIGPETAASGLIVPGDRVDILLSVPVPAFNEAGKIAPPERASVETLLRGIRVLAIDQQTDGQPGRAIVGQAATLEVTPKEAEIVTLANELAVRGGMLVLTLRSLKGESAQAEHAVASSQMLDTDVSKFLTNRPVTPSLAPLTIVRRGMLSEP